MGVLNIREVGVCSILVPLEDIEALLPAGIHGSDTARRGVLRLFFENCGRDQRTATNRGMALKTGLSLFFADPKRRY